MNKTITGAVLVLIVLGGGYYLLTKNSSGEMPVQSPAETTQPTAPTPTPDASPTSTAAVSIQNFSFNPAALSVKTGTAVTWTNNDSVPHTVTSDSGLFDSSTLAPGQSFSYIFSAAMTAAYHCSIHPMMKGTITVSN